jgi:hypothetical protein
VAKIRDRPSLPVGLTLLRGLLKHWTKAAALAIVSLCFLSVCLQESLTEIGAQVVIPTISSIDVDQATPLTTISIDGADFDDAGQVSVVFSETSGGTPLSVSVQATFVSASNILVGVPFQLTGPVAIEVSEQIGSETVVSNEFNRLQHPGIAAVKSAPRSGDDAVS